MGDLAAGGIATMDGIHAVFDMATAPSHKQAMLAGRFQSLTQKIAGAGNEAGRRAFSLAMGRLLFVAVQTLGVSPHPKVMRPSPATVMASLTSVMEGESPEMQRVARMAADSRLAADFIRTIGDPPPRPDLLAAAAAVVLRDVLHTRGAHDDPLQRWTLFGQVSNAVIAAHYLNSPQRHHS
jgi:hypothetical protein